MQIFVIVGDRRVFFSFFKSNEPLLRSRSRRQIKINQRSSGTYSPVILAAILLRESKEI